MWFFWTPEITAKFGTAYSNKCLRNCGPHIGHQIHIFWSCPKLGTFWEEVFETLNEVFDGNITVDPMVALLGLLPKEIKGRAKKYVLQILLATAIKHITIRWVKPDPPTYGMWTEKIKKIYQMEQITYSLRLQKYIFTRS